MAVTDDLEFKTFHSRLHSNLMVRYVYYRTTSKPSEIEETERQSFLADNLQARPLLITPVVSTLLDSVYRMVSVYKICAVTIHGFSPCMHDSRILLVLVTCTRVRASPPRHGAS